MLRLRSPLPLLVVLLLLAVPAHAATYWVSPAGTSGKSGADSLSNATTLAWFNANAVAGDVCRFKSGTYTDPIKPAHDGTSSSRIRYYGFAADPWAVIVADLQFGYAHGSYCTARWVSSTTGMTGLSEGGAAEAVYDSIVGCRITGENGQFNIGSKASVVDSLSITGQMTDTGQTHFVNISGERDHYNNSIGEWSIGSTSNTFSNSTVNVTVNTSSGMGDVHVLLFSAAAYNRVVGNTFNVTVAHCFGYFFGIEQYEGYYNQIQNNTWNIALNGAIGGSRGVWCHRDSSSYNRYMGNTVTVTGSGSDVSFMLSNPGSFSQTTHDNFYGNNVIRDDSPTSGTGVFWWYDGTRRDTIQFNTITTNGGAPAIVVPVNADLDGTVFRHNTLYTTGTTALDVGRANPTNGARAVSNIYYCTGTNASGSENVKAASGFGLDSSGVYFSPGSSSASHAIAYGGTDGKPGAGGGYGIASEALWGSPRFADSTYATFNPRLTSTSYAGSSGLFDAFAGAVPFAGGASDTTPPATVSNLAVSTPGLSSLLVSWTAPGNDGMSGTAASYDLRVSTSPITAVNFAAATPVSPQPVPASGGTAQSYVALGLTQGTTYYFALRARDATGNWSGVSNTASGTTTAGDTIPPAAIHDLATSP